MGMGNKQTHSQSQSETETEQEISRLPPSGRQSRLREAGDNLEEVDDLEVAEVPPPMRPISSMPAPEDSSIKRVRVYF